MRSTRAASESTTGTPGASESPAARGGRAPRARSGTFSGVSSGKASPCWLLSLCSQRLQTGITCINPLGCTSLPLIPTRLILSAALMETSCICEWLVVVREGAAR